MSIQTPLPIPSGIGTRGALNPWGPWKPTQWYGAIPGGLGTTMTMVKGRIYFLPFPAPAPFPVAVIGLNVKTVVATTTIRVGIYKDDGGFAPGAKLVDLTTVTGASAGLKQIIYTATLPAGLWWLCAVRQGSSTAGTLNVTKASTQGSEYRTGIGPYAGQQGSLLAPLYRSTTATFTGALPATAPALTVERYTAPFPGISLKAA